ncbi:unnamed protein product [Soboliphyme baturini]|uniref:BSD domain-containing protein n=1 Tax=Soboliphyme baturini TaxID=241478 RepID=A0A183IBD6_9BILA|nr:unnamed protein product [Soboliphyme baturini]
METENAVQDDLLLHVDNVACRKFGEGILTVMKDRLIWRSTIAQKVSPANKLKVQLQICLQNGANTTFQFLNPLGSEGQLRDRESVKELLQQLLPRFRRKLLSCIGSVTVLQSNKTLLSLYKELVVSKVLSTEDFWNYFVQKTGVSAGFNGMTQTDACNEVKFNITNDIMLSIFRIYPTVKQKHMELVPSQMTEEQFWTQFFNSHYFHRDRLTNLNPKEVFVDCLRIETDIAILTKLAISLLFDNSIDDFDGCRHSISLLSGFSGPKVGNGDLCAFADLF